LTSDLPGGDERLEAQRRCSFFDPTEGAPRAHHVSDVVRTIEGPVVLVAHSFARCDIRETSHAVSEGA
jgi:predicted alpha/beta hydrolase family esterase